MKTVMKDETFSDNRNRVRDNQGKGSRDEGQEGKLPAASAHAEVRAKKLDEITEVLKLHLVSSTQICQRYREQGMEEFLYNCTISLLAALSDGSGQ